MLVSLIGLHNQLLEATLKVHINAYKTCQKFGFFFKNLFKFFCIYKKIGENIPNEVKKL